MIEAAHLSKQYGRGVYALRDLSISIDKGEFIFLTGSSGAGKSTFLRLLLREELPSEGELTVAGRDLAAMSASQLQSYRRSLGFVFGAVRGLLLCVIAFIFFSWLVPEKTQPEWVKNARMKPLLQATGDQLMAVLPDDPEGFLTGVHTCSRLRARRPASGGWPNRTGPLWLVS